MFVGHYGIAFAAKRLAPRISLGTTFIAVQLLDILWAPAILTGLEHARIVPGYLPGSSFVFYDIPWTHGLLMAIAFSWLAFRLSKSAILGACVFSHWVLDWVTHLRDLPLFRGGPLVGLGLWRYRHLTFLTETALLLAGLLLYLQATRPKSRAGEFAIPGFVVALIVLGAYNLYGPPPANIRVAALIGEGAYLALAAIAFFLDRLREPLPPEPQTRLGISEA